MAHYLRHSARVSTMLCFLAVIPWVSRAQAEETASQNSPVVHMTVQDEKIAKLDDRLFGQFQQGTYLGELGPENIMEPGTRTLRPDIEKMLLDLHVPLIRYPGGTDIDFTDWRDRIDNVPGRPAKRAPFRDRVHGVTNNFGIDEYFVLRDKLQCQTLSVVNAVDGLTKKVPLEEAALNAAGFVAYCNAPQGAKLPEGMPDWPAVRAKNGHPEPYHIQFVQIGNELFLGKAEKVMKSTGIKDPAELAKWYLTCLTAYIEKIREVDPNIDIVIDARMGLGMEKTVLADAYIRQQVKYATIHVVAPAYTDDVKLDGKSVAFKDLLPDELWKAWMAMPGKFNERGENIGFGGDNSEDAYENASALGYRFTCTEWNWSILNWYTLKTHPPFGQKWASALGTIGYLHGLMRNCDRIDVACMSTLLGQTWDINTVHYDPTEKVPTYYSTPGFVHMLYTKHHGNALLKSEVDDSPKYQQPYSISWNVAAPTGVASIDALATGDEHTIFIHALNRDEYRDIAFHVDLSSFHLNNENAQWHLVTGRLNDQPRAGESIRVYKLEERTVPVEQSSMSAVLPAHSISIFEISRAP